MTKKKTASRWTGTLASFIRLQPKSKTAKEVVAAGALVGLSIDPSVVYSVRKREGRGSPAPASVAPKSENGKSAERDVRNLEELLKKRLEELETFVRDNKMSPAAKALSAKALSAMGKQATLRAMVQAATDCGIELHVQLKKKPEETSVSVADIFRAAATELGLHTANCLLNAERARIATLLQGASLDKDIARENRATHASAERDFDARLRSECARALAQAEDAPSPAGIGTAIAAEQEARRELEPIHAVGLRRGLREKGQEA